MDAMAGWEGKGGATKDRSKGKDTKGSAPNGSSTVDRIDLGTFESSQVLAELGMAALKDQLQARGLKCGTFVNRLFLRWLIGCLKDQLQARGLK